MSAIAAEIDAQHAAVLERLKETDGWTSHGIEQQVELYTKPIKSLNNATITCCKGVAVLPFSATAVAAVFLDLKYRPKWDKQMIEGRTLLRLDKGTTVHYARFNGLWFTSPRDLLWRSRVAVTPEGQIWITSLSVPPLHAALKPSEKYVRAHLVLGGTHCEPLNEHSCRVTYTVALDARGSVPNFAANKAVVKAPLVLATIREFMEKNGDQVEALPPLFNMEDIATQLPSSFAASPSGRLSMSTSLGSPSPADSKIPSSPLPPLSPVPFAGVSEVKSPEQPAAPPRDLSSMASPAPAPAPPAVETVPVPAAAPAPAADATPAFKYAPCPYDQQLQAAYDEALASCVDGEVGGFKHKVTQDDVVVFFKRLPNSELVCSKGVGTLPYSPAIVHRAFSDGDLRKEWDDIYMGGRIVQSFDEKTHCTYSVFKAPWPVSNREFCVIMRTEIRPDGSIFTWSTSAEHAQAPLGKGNVRGKVLLYGLLVSPVPGNPNAARVIYSSGSDPCGSIPTSFVNAAALKQPLCIAVIRKLLQKRPDLAKKLQAAVAAESAVAVPATAATTTTSAGANPAAANAPAKPAAAPAGSTDSKGREFAPTPYDELLDQCYAQCMDAIKGGPAEGWAFNSKQKDVDIYIKKDGNSPVTFCKGVGVIPAPPSLVKFVFVEPKLRPLWDDMFNSGKRLQIFDAFTSVSYSNFKAPAFVWPRDFCVVGRSRLLEDGSELIYSTSCTHPDGPTAKGHVRGTLLYSAVLLEPVPGNPGACRVTYALASDPNGSIPKSLVNAVSVKQPLCIATIRDFIANKAQLIAQAQREAQEEAAASQIAAAAAAGDDPADGEDVPEFVDWTEEKAGAEIRQFLAVPGWVHTQRCVSALGSKLVSFAKREPAPALGPVVVGYLVVRAVGTRGPAFSTVGADTVQLRLSVGATEHKTPSGTAAWSETYFFPVFDAEQALLISASGFVTGRGTVTVGSAPLSLPDLTAPLGSNGKARLQRAWHRLGEAGVGSGSVCLETVYVYSKSSELLADFSVERPESDCMFVSQTAADDAKPSASSTTSARQQRAAKKPARAPVEPYSAAAFVRTCYNLYDAAAPFVGLSDHAATLFSWKKPSQSVLIILLFALSVWAPRLFPVLLGLSMLFYALSTAADQHFETVVRDSVVYRLQQQERDEYRRKVIECLRSEDDNLSLDQRKSLMWLQTKIGQTANAINTFRGVWEWRAPEVTSFACLATGIFVLLSLLGFTVTSVAFALLIISAALSPISNECRWAMHRAYVWSVRRARFARSARRALSKSASS